MTSPSPRAITLPAVPAPAGRSAELTCETDLGGVFFLLNLAQYLGLYGDFTAPRDPGIDLDPWDLLTLLGRALLGRPEPEDAVWPLLATLAGRGPRDRAGRGFAPEEWRVPPDWLAPFEDRGPWAWSAAHGRLRVDHPAGFPVLDVARTKRSPRAQLAQELRRLPSVEASRRSLRPLPATPLRRWTLALAAYVRARLSVALGRPRERAARLLLQQRAAVLVSGLQVDVTMALATLPIEIRIAGLDRDPGWIPAAGRSVAFHFD